MTIVLIVARVMFIKIEDQWNNFKMGRDQTERDIFYILEFL